MQRLAPSITPDVTPDSWLVTGCAGLIGSHLVEHLLRAGQKVTGVDNFVTGYKRNIQLVKESVSEERWKNFHFVEGDLRDLKVCREVVRPGQIILHHAALGSVALSISDPLANHAHNVNGFLNLLFAAKEAKVRRFIFASSSSVYGDDPKLPNVESAVGEPLSPYAVTKKIDEIYAQNFSRVYGLETVGLRYFNIFGPRQDPLAAYAAVIPLWIKSFSEGKPVFINGDGKTSRDFCYVKNVVQANFLAAACAKDGTGRVYNIGVGEHNNLNQLFGYLKDMVGEKVTEAKNAKPLYRDFRPGDILHSVADISLAKKYLGYSPSFGLRQGLSETVSWFLNN